MKQFETYSLCGTFGFIDLINETLVNGIEHHLVSILNIAIGITGLYKFFKDLKNKKNNNKK